MPDLLARFSGRTEVYLAIVIPPDRRSPRVLSPYFLTLSISST
jgi:hypothetical protein